MLAIDWIKLATVVQGLFAIVQGFFAFRLVSLQGKVNVASKETLQLQTRMQKLQEDIEERRTQIRLYARIWRTKGQEVTLRVSNLSDFDLWINKVELVVTQAAIVQPGAATIGGPFLLSSGKTEEGLQLQGNLIALNGNRNEALDMYFHVTVEALGLTERPILVNSPNYRLVWGPGGGPTLETLR